RKLIDGQAQDISFEHREFVSVEECLEMEGNKTGALLACAASIGAVLGGADDAAADALETYGHHLGLAFQAVDDLLGIWGDPAATGKQTWSDLRQRKKSLPVAAAVAASGGAARRLTALLTADAKKSQEEFADFDEAEFAARAALIEEAGGRQWTADEARRQHDTALRALDGLDMPARVRAQLVELADFIVIREK
ncbi:polyprenyl synthetase family protein, partial [Streptomyces harbinensis]|uniref:polyprenyl synthetase family protein n=2 Tax=Streptomyces TaxID=1883 RepID=UPI0034DF2354